MYKIIGADGRQYGPVAVEAVREWIAAGRANAQTMVQPEGATDWKPLGSLPEFAEALAAKVLLRYPVHGAPDRGRSRPERIGRRHPDSRL